MSGALLDFTDPRVVVGSILSLLILVALYRVARGPTIADRVVALDFVGTLAVGLLAVYSILTNRVTVLDAAIGVALIMFFGTVVFASYLERRGRE